MKLRKKKTPNVDTEALADELGNEYAAAFEREKTAAGIKKGVADRIKAIAEETGETQGDQCLLRGAKYEVGYATIAAQKVVDWALFKKQQPKIYSKLLSPAIDETKVEHAIKDGTLPRKLLGKYLMDKNEPSKRIIVRLAGEETKDE